MKLYIIRHGQTDWNVEQRIQGRRDIPLNEMGRRQAACLKEAMGTRPVVSVFSSPLIRAGETAQAAAGPWNAPIVTVEELAEVHYGLWEGRKAEDLLTEDRERYEAWMRDPAGTAPPQGETLEQIRERCRKAWELIRKELTGDSAIVSHGGILVHLICEILGAKGEASQSVVHNASITTIEYDPDSRSSRLICLDEQAHLKLL